MNKADELLLKSGYDLNGNRVKFPPKKKAKKHKVKVVLPFNPNSKEVKARLKSSKHLIQLRVNSEPSAGEKAVIDFLTANRILFKREKYGPKLFNPKTNSLLFFDFYLPDYNLVIEFDGCHHFKIIDGDKDKFLEVKYRDRIKNEFCQKNGIHLLRLKNIKEVGKRICQKIDFIAPVRGI